MGFPKRRLIGAWTAGPMPNRRSTDREPRRGWIPILFIAVGVAAFDWITKALDAASVPVDTIVVVVEDRLALWHVKNPAMILGLFGDLSLGMRQILAAMLAIVAATLLLEVATRSHRLLPHRRGWAWLFVGLVLGGMIGNIGERILHWGITDFLAIGWRGIWLPPGNVADLAIFMSIPIAPLIIAFEIEARSRRSRPAPGGGMSPRNADLRRRAGSA